MKIKKKHRKWLYLAILAIAVIILAKSAFTVENIMGIPFFSQAFAVIGPGELAYSGDTFEHSFTLTNRDTQTLPLDLYDSDGDGVTDTRIMLYKGYRMNRYNTLGTQEIVDSGCDTPDGSCDYVEEIPLSEALLTGGTTSISLVFTIDATTPSSYSGHPYGVSAMLFKVTQTWDRATNTWSETPTIIDSIDTDTSLGVQFQVSTQTPPPSPSPTDIWDWFNALLASIWEALKTLLGWA